MVIQEFFIQLRKSIKQISIYRHLRGKYHEYLKKPYELLVQQIDADSVVTLDIEPRCIKHDKTVIYSDQEAADTLACRLYRDGIRIIVFKSGITPEELTKFVLVCLENPQNDESLNIASLFWEQEFEHIEIVVMDSFFLGSESAEQTQLEVDKIVSCLYRGISTRSKDTMSFARLSLDDLEIEIRGVSQISGLKVRDNIIKKSKIEEYQKQLKYDSQVGNLSRFTKILLNLFRLELDQEIEDKLFQAYDHLIDGLILQENIGKLFVIVDELENSTSFLTQNRPIGQKIAAKLKEKLNSQDCIVQIGEVLETNNKPETLDKIGQYFSRLDERAISPLLSILQRLTRIEARALIRNILVGFGEEHIDVYSSHLQSTKVNYVRDLLAIIQDLKTVSIVKHVSPLICHPVKAIRLEALGVLGNCSEVAAVTYVLMALSDSDSQIRILAAELLPNFDRFIALKALIAACKESDFDKRSTEEQVAVYSSLAILATPETMKFMRGRFFENSILQRRNRMTRKRNMIAGFALSGSISAYRFLKNELNSGSLDKEMESLFSWACLSIKEQLIG